MYKGHIAELQMVRNILDEGYLDENVYECEVLADDIQEGSIILQVKSEQLPIFSLDGLYECKVIEDGTMLICNGMIIERFESKAGKVLAFQMKNGFYKKVLN